MSSYHQEADGRDVTGDAKPVRMLIIQAQGDV